MTHNRTKYEQIRIKYIYFHYHTGIVDMIGLNCDIRKIVFRCHSMSLKLKLRRSGCPLSLNATHLGTSSFFFITFAYRPTELISSSTSPLWWALISAAIAKICIPKHHKLFMRTANGKTKRMRKMVKKEYITRLTVDRINQIKLNLHAKR